MRRVGLAPTKPKGGWFTANWYCYSPIDAFLVAGPKISWKSLTPTHLLYPWPHSVQIRHCAKSELNEHLRITALSQSLTSVGWK